MRRYLLVVLAAVILGSALGWIVTAQPDIPGYVVSDLQLISQESKADWSEKWTGPIQAATILAWFADHGYPAFLRDFNNDGVIDELDTIELADILGRIFMSTETIRGTTDVRLVLGLAQYVAETYPGQFVLKIYDSGLPGEMAMEAGQTYDPNLVAGIELVLEVDPSIAAYEEELESGEGVVIGIELSDGNTYLSGRSFLYEPTTGGNAPIDLAWSSEDYWLVGNQGKVLETVGKMDDVFYLDYQSGWERVEFMLALSPADDPHGTSDPNECPDNAIAYDVFITEIGDTGSVEVEECVTRTDDVDTYTYTVTNIDFLYNGCGLCLFAIPKPVTLATLTHSESVPWLYSLYPSAWVWRLPLGSCGILPGESAVFSVSVPGPTSDSLVIGVIGSCATFSPSGVYQPSELAGIRTTGPADPDEESGCPDLAVRYLDQSCQCDPIDGVCTLRVWVDVVNVGTETILVPFDISLTSLGHPGGDTQTYIVPPIFAPGDVWPVQLSYTFSMGGELCPMDYVVTVDPSPAPDGVIAECDESNNSYFGSIDCFCDEQERGACCLPDGSCVEITSAECADEGGDFHPGVSCAVVQCPPPEQSCVDLIVEITEMSCRNVGAAAPQYELTIEALVTNIGSATVTESIWVRASTDCGSDTDIVHTDLDPGDSATAEFVIECGIQGGCHPLTVTVDHTLFIVECDENNNEDTDTVCCR